LAISSCSTIAIAPSIKLPPRLKLEPVTMDEFHCTTDDTVEHCQTFTVNRATLRKIIHDTNLLKARIITLRNMIKATQGKK